MSRDLSPAVWSLLDTTDERASPDEETSALFRASSPRVLSFLRRRFTDEVAEDATQEAFLRLHRVRRGGTRIDNPEAWLARVAKHVAIDQLRHARHDVPLTGAAIDAVEASGQPIDTPEQRCWRLQRLELLRHEIGKLSDIERTCLRLRTEGMTFQRIAAQVGMDYRRVAELVARLLKRLHRVVRDAGYLPS